MGDIDGSARIEDGKNGRIIKASGVRGTVLDLGETESMSARPCQETRRAVYLGAIERRARASRISDAEGVFGEGVQEAAGIVKELECLVAGVGDGRGNL